jgi:hypothetical protein
MLVMAARGARPRLKGHIRKGWTMKGFVHDIERAAVASQDFRRVLYTAPHCVRCTTPSR